jgi:heptosyltransferase-2
LELFTTAQDEAGAAKVWGLAQFNDYPEVICLNPGAAFGSSKHWPAEYFAELAQDLVRRRGCGVLVLCGPAERTLAREIVERADSPHVYALGGLGLQGGPALSLGLTKACIRRADLLVTTDSGPRHFAHAFDRPVVTLFGPTHIAWTETYHPRAIHLQKQVECGPCQKRVCPLDHRCMKRLLPQEVLVAAESLLQGT